MSHQNDPANPKEENNREKTNRRNFLGLMTKTTLTLAAAGQGMLYLRSLSPNVLYEPEKRVRAGVPQQFPEGVTYVSSGRFFVIRRGNDFQALSAICTHLGCTVNLHRLDQSEEVSLPRGGKITQEWEFLCPCHGSQFRGNGAIYAGPAPTNLSHYQIGLAPDGQLMVDTGTPVASDYKLTV